MKYTIEFITDDTLKDNAINKYTEFLRLLHKKIGYEQLNSRLEVLSLEWALNSGYYLTFEGNKLIFKHVSI